MITLQEYKKRLRYAVRYSASLRTIKRIAGDSKVKHLPARSKLCIAMKVRQQVKDMTFATRYVAVGTPLTSRQVYEVFVQQVADFSKLENLVIANMPQSSRSYLEID